MKKHLITISKFLSLVLRHSPEKIGLFLDDHGWAEVADLISKASAHGIKLNREILEEVVQTNDKKRFSFSKDEKKIRANQGHSIKIDLDLSPLQPPPVLFHGTTSRFLEAIKTEGLIKGRRNHVHFSIDIKTAVEVGKRHGQPVVLTVDAKKMYENGFKFYLSENNIWLTESVPPEYINWNENEYSKSSKS